VERRISNASGEALSQLHESAPISFRPRPGLLGKGSFLKLVRWQPSSSCARRTDQGTTKLKKPEMGQDLERNQGAPTAPFGVDSAKGS